MKYRLPAMRRWVVFVGAMFAAAAVQPPARAQIPPCFPDVCPSPCPDFAPDMPPSDESSGGGAAAVMDPATPAVSLRLRVPSTVSVGQEIEYRILVENTSGAPAH